MPRIGLINLVKRGTSQTDQEGLVIFLCRPWRALEGKVWPEGLCSSEGILPCVGCVGIMEAKPELM